MPYLLIAGAGLATWIGAQVSGWGRDAADTITGTPKSVSAGVPSWVIPTGLVIVGGVLLYRYGAKVLKI